MTFRTKTKQNKTKTTTTTKREMTKQEQPVHHWLLLADLSYSLLAHRPNGFFVRNAMRKNHKWVEARGLCGGTGVL
jgi:hypothetical protein